MAVHPPDKASFFQLHCFVDAMDSSQHWLAAMVKEVDPAKGILVRFDGWSNKWNEWLSLRSLRLAPFRRYSRGYGGQESAALRDWTFDESELQPVADTLQRVQEGDLSDFQSPYDVTQFFRGRLFTLVDNLLGNAVPSENTATVLNFLQQVETFALWWMKTLPQRYATLYQGLSNADLYLTDTDCALAEIWPELFVTVERILGCDRRLKDFLTLEVPEEEVKLQCLESLPEGVKAISLMAHRITSFVTSSGFDIIEGLVGDENLPLWNLYSRVRESPEFEKRYLALANKVVDRLSHFSERDQKHYDKLTIQSIFRIAGQFAGTDREGLIRRIEETELQIALTLLKSKVLDKRVKGVNAIVEAIARTDVANVEQFDWFDEGKMVQWLQHSGVKDTILTDRPHIEILKRSQSIFCFLALQNEITQADIEHLWNSTIDMHESFVRTVYDLITNLANVLSKPLLDQIYEKWRQLDISSSADYAILAMKQFTQNAAKALKAHSLPVETYCLLEFNFYLRSSQANDSKAEIVSNAIVDMLAGEEFQDLRGPIMTSLLSGSAQVQSVQMLLRLLQTLPADVSREFLEKQDADLVQRVIQWICAIGDREAGEEELRTYLRFLEVAASKCEKVKVENNDLQRLWSQFTSDSSPLNYTETFFSWLRYCLETSAGFLVTSDLSFRIYSDYLCLLPAETIARLKIEAFLCFQQYFLHVNAAYRNLSKQDDYVVSRLRENLYGVETLVLFALHGDNAIAGKAVRVLAQLHTRILKEAESGIVEKFVEERVKAIRDLQSSTDLSADSLICRNLRILTGIIDAYDYILTPKAHTLSFTDWQTIYYRLPDENTWKVVHIPRTECLGTLRRSIASLNGFQADCVKLEYAQSLYTFVEDEKIMGKLGHALHFSVRHELHDYVFKNVTEVIGDNESSQTLLFDLISRQSKPYSESIWFLLSRLTSNKLLQVKIKELGVTFSALLDQNSFYKQLFCLMVLNQLKKADGFEATFKRLKPNALMNLLESNAEQSGGSLVDYFQGQTQALVLHYAQIALELIFTFKDGQNYLKRDRAVLYVMDLLFLYAKFVMENSEFHRPSVPHCAWSSILESIDIADLPSFQTAISQYSNLEGLMFCSLRAGKNPFFSSQMKDFFLHLSEEPLNLFPRISELLLSALSDAVRSPKTSREYFSLLSKLIKRQKDGHFESEFGLLYGYLRECQAELHPKEEDKGLTGALKVMRAMVGKSESLRERSVAEYVLQTCLLDSAEPHSSTHPKCKSTNSRLAAFKLLSALADQAEIRSYLLSELRDFHTDLSWRKGKMICWTNAPNAYEKSTTGFVGIKNLGCTCYMNSMLQQLFMIKSFSSGLLQCESPPDFPPDDNVLYQLQKVMVGLRHSDKMFIQAKGLCEAFKNWEGMPINPREQMDVDEFFNGLMDKTEEILKQSNTPKLVEHHFRGILTTQCIGKGACTHRSERDEPFLTLPLEIKNKRSILESLDVLIGGELLEGDNAYQCDYCTAKVTAKRRICIRSLPNVLLFSLRRFDFDMDTMNRVKLNSYCEFPMTLNMEPYTLEAVTKRDAGKEQEDGEATSPQSAIPPGNYQYFLRGIIIHTGYAEAGHYYSYILDQDTGKWLEFNDTIVDTFNSESIPSEAFGVMEKLSGGISREEVGKLRNAYVLLYERSEKYQVKTKDDTTVTPLPLHETTELSPSSAALQEKVVKANQRHWRKKRVFSLEYSHFVLSLTQKPSPDVLLFALSHFLSTQIRCKDTPRKLMRYLHQALSQNAEAAETYLEMLSYEPLTKELLFDCPLNEPRKFVVGLADACLQVVSVEVQARVLRRLLALLPKLPLKITTPLAAFFELLYRIARINPELATAKQLPQALISLLLKKELPAVEEEYPPVTSDYAHLGRAADDICERFPQSAASYGPSCTFQIATLNVTGGLSPDDITQLMEPATIRMVIKGAHGKFGANQAAKLYLSLMNDSELGADVFASYSHTLLGELNANDYDQHKTILVQLKRLIMQVDDTRAEEVLAGVVDVMKSNMGYIRATESVVGFLYRLVCRVQRVRQWVWEHSDYFAPLVPWSQKYQTWTSQAATGLYLTKVYTQHSTFNEYHPNNVLPKKILLLVSQKVPEVVRDEDSDDDLYESPLATGAKAEFCPKEDMGYRIEIMDSFSTTYYVRYENSESGNVFFLSADDDRLMRSGIKYQKD